VSPVDPVGCLPPDVVRDVRNLLLSAARDSLYCVHESEASRYRAAPDSSTTPW
jgi:hypothetical protein